MMHAGLPPPIDPQSQIYKIDISDSAPTSKPKKTPTWRKGSNARFNYTVNAYVTPELQAAADEEVKRITSDHAHGHPKDQHVHKDGCCGSNDAKNPTREDALKERAQGLESLLAQLKLASTPVSKQKPNIAKPPSSTTQQQSTPSTSLPKDSKPTRKRIGSSLETNPPNTPYFELRIGLGFSVPMFEKCVKTMTPGSKARFLCMPSETDGYAQLESILRQEAKNRVLVSQGKPPVRTSGCCAAQGIAGDPDALEMQRDLLLLTGAVLELEIELVDVIEPGDFCKEVWEMSALEKYVEAPVRKEEGGALYRSKDFEGACAKYTRALVLLESLSTSPSVTDMQREITKLKDEMDRELRRRVLERKRLERLGRDVPAEFTIEGVDAYFKEADAKITHPDYSGNNGINPSVVISLMQTCRLNYAACKLKLGEFSTVIIQCSEVLKNDKANVKALFRRAQAYRKIGRDLELAQKDLNSLRDLFVGRGIAEDNGEFVELKREEKELEVKFKAVQLKEKKMYGNMFA
ncbi:UNVERIFIED_CONTAM: hypothetical protein HDU68_003190 [Siphonaria sp. JEL0065]|nr:hypothetical protein HDU68_003190 [Siphonaria sp. JEL0065]